MCSDRTSCLRACPFLLQKGPNRTCAPTGKPVSLQFEFPVLVLWSPGRDSAVAQACSAAAPWCPHELQKEPELRFSAGGTF